MPPVETGANYVDVEIHDLNLTAGRYLVSLFVGNLGGVYHDALQHCATVDIEHSNRYGLGRGIHGNPVVSFRCGWRLHANGNSR